MCQKLKKYSWNILIALDQLLNVLLFGYPDETLSARAYRKAQAGQRFWKAARFLIDALFFFQPGHCRAAYDSEWLRNHSPYEFRLDRLEKK